ncbi:MAG: hypothetical protein EU536_01405 [Promethearchaeota archaeon]|nr:MAG: hypothetical protein EU536_01405 [Candidatus Lokiarchaeota archaeon]
MATPEENTTLFNKLDTANLDMLSQFIVPLILTLFFIQAFRAYVPGIYIAMFHVVFQDPGWIGSLLTLLTLALFFVPLFTNKLCKKFSPKKVYLTSIAGVALLRLLMAAHLPSLVETILAALIVALYGIFASTFLKYLLRSNLKIDLQAKMSLFVLAFIAAFLVDSVFRTLGFSADISLIPLHLNPEAWFTLQYVWLAVQVPLSLLVLWFAVRGMSAIFPETQATETDEMRNEPWVLNAGGLGMILFLLFNVFLYPSVLAEYTGCSYVITNPIMIVGITLAVLYLLFVKENVIYRLTSTLILNILLILCLGVVVFVGMLSFLVGIIIFVLFVNTSLLIVNMGTRRKKGNQLKQFSKLFCYGTLFLILMSFLHDFSTDHAFTVSAFQGAGPMILFIAGIIAAFTTILANLQLNQYRKGGTD